MDEKPDKPCHESNKVAHKNVDPQEDQEVVPVVTLVEIPDMVSSEATVQENPAQMPTELSFADRFKFPDTIISDFELPTRISLGRILNAIAWIEAVYLTFLRNNGVPTFEELKEFHQKAIFCQSTIASCEMGQYCTERLHFGYWSFIVLYFHRVKQTSSEIKKYCIYMGSFELSDLFFQYSPWHERAKLIRLKNKLADLQKNGKPSYCMKSFVQIQFLEDYIKFLNQIKMLTPEVSPDCKPTKTPRCTKDPVGVLQYLTRTEGAPMKPDIHEFASAEMTEIVVNVLRIIGFSGDDPEKSGGSKEPQDPKKTDIPKKSEEPEKPEVLDPEEPENPKILEIPEIPEQSKEQEETKEPQNTKEPEEPNILEIPEIQENPEPENPIELDIPEISEQPKEQEETKKPEEPNILEIPEKSKDPEPENPIELDIPEISEQPKDQEKAEEPQDPKKPEDPEVLYISETSQEHLEKKEPKKSRKQKKPERRVLGVAGPSRLCIEKPQEDLIVEDSMDPIFISESKQVIIEIIDLTDDTDDLDFISLRSKRPNAYTKRYHPKYRKPKKFQKTLMVKTDSSSDSENDALPSVSVVEVEADEPMLIQSEESEHYSSDGWYTQDYDQGALRSATLETERFGTITNELICPAGSSTLEERIYLIESSSDGYPSDEADFADDQESETEPLVRRNSDPPSYGASLDRTILARSSSAPHLMNLSDFVEVYEEVDEFSIQEEGHQFPINSSVDYTDDQAEPLLRRYSDSLFYGASPDRTLMPRSRSAPPQENLSEFVEAFQEVDEPSSQEEGYQISITSSGIRKHTRDESPDLTPGKSKCEEDYAHIAKKIKFDDTREASPEIHQDNDPASHQDHDSIIEPELEVPKDDDNQQQDPDDSSKGDLPSPEKQ